MRTIKYILMTAALIAFPAASRAQQQPAQPTTPAPAAQPAQPAAVTFNQAAKSIEQRLEESLAELNQLREQVVAEKIPLSRKLREMESTLLDVRQEYEDTTRVLDIQKLDVSNLQNEIKTRKEEASYISNLLGEYTRNFESRLHIAELQRYREPLEAAKLAPENKGLSEVDVYQQQAALLTAALNRLQAALGGDRFDGQAVDSEGDLVKSGKFVLIGPAALFQSTDGQCVGFVEQRLGSLEPAVIPFGNPDDAAAARNMISNGTGLFPLDPTLGNARKIEETQESLFEHIKKGGPVMYPIFILAGLALLVALYKWVALSRIRKPSDKKLTALLDAVARHDETAAMAEARGMGGPVGEMLVTGVEHLKEPRDLIEEVMYEKMLSARLKLQRFLPFISICAASAPLLGLLGTVTGIINTFKLIQAFGSGDVKSLSGGISEALITTEYGLIVAIPSLLIYSFLSRRAKSVTDQMEKSAVVFVNQISRNPYNQTNAGSAVAYPAGLAVGTLSAGNPAPVAQYSRDSAGSLMNQRALVIHKTATVADAITKIRNSGNSDNLDTIFIVDENHKYLGYVLTRQLLTRPENAPMESLTNKQPAYVRVDTHKNDVRDLFHKHALSNMPVLDHNDILVGQITRSNNGDGL